MNRRIIIKSNIVDSVKDEAGHYVKTENSYKRDLLNLGQSFPKQYAFTEDKATFLAAQCSRRAGKTNGLALRFFKTLETHPKSQCIYLALTKDSAEAIMWPILQELNDKYNLGCTFTKKMTMKHPNGSYLRLLGADMPNFIRRLKGIKSPGIAIDEAQDFGSHLQSLVDDVITPTLADYPDSWLAITGTPGAVPKGYFYEVTQEKKYGYSLHEWTVLDNPYMPDANKFINELKKKRGWLDDNPTLQREWLNRWVLDLESLWVRYSAANNHYIQLPNIVPGKWNYIMGIDLGFKDADALAVLAWSESDPNTYLVEEVVTKKQGLTELVKQIQTLRDKYSVYKLVIDEGGLGKKLAEEMRRQHHIPVQPADKARKQETIEFLNDALRLGKFKAKSGSRFAQDSYLIQIDWDKSTPSKIVIKKDPHSDIIDAVLYAFKESPAYTYEKPKTILARDTKEWAEQQQQEMFDNAMEHFTQQAELERRLSGNEE